MRLLKPAWVNHDGHPIFSVDIHPDGSRFATGGQGESNSGRVVIWNMGPVKDETEELRENVPKELSRMDNHLNCVNCVRWSTDGKYLASAGDDKEIMVWQIARYNSSNPSPFVGSNNAETWRCVTALRGHGGDILDLSWSPTQPLMASCSVDNNVIIWSTSKWNDIVITLRGHTGLVKGVSFDPIGKYVASQSDDKSVKIWRTSDWKEEESISDPFKECGGTTHVLRLNWSPDGQYLVSAHAMNNCGSTAQIIEREGWATKRDLVGHRKAVTCVRFCPHLLTKIPKKNHSSVKRQTPYTCMALGSRDRSLSIWVTSLQRPLVVIHDLFASSVLDISWSACGRQMLACSWDGTVSFIEFDESELGRFLKDDDATGHMERLYGRAIGHSLTGELIENPEILGIREEQLRKKQQQAQQTNGHHNHESRSQDSRSNASSSRLVKGPTDKQIETVMSCGKRRITPLYIPPPIDYDGTPIPFNSTQTTFRTTTENKTTIFIEKRDSPNKSDPSTSRDAASRSRPQSPQKTSDPQQQQHSVQANKATVQIIRSTPGTADKEKMPKSVKRPTEQPQATPQVKRKPGRPPQSQNKPAQSQTFAPPATVTTEPAAKPTSAPAAVLANRRVIVTDRRTNRQLLPPLRSEKSGNFALTRSNSNINDGKFIQVENRDNGIGILRLVDREKKHWEAILASKISAAGGCETFVCAACDDHTLNVYSTSTGTLLELPLMASGPIARLTCEHGYLMIITSEGRMTLWGIDKDVCLIRNEAMSSLFSLSRAAAVKNANGQVSASTSSSEVTIVSCGINADGVPLVTLSSGKTFAFNVNKCCWSVMANASHPLANCSNIKHLSSRDSANHPLASMFSMSRIRTSHNVFSSNSTLQTSATLSYIDQQLIASFKLGSSKEYRHWLLALVQHLVDQTNVNRLKELCESLVGPVFSCGTDWNSTVLGMDKRTLLDEVLTCMTTNLRLQRMYSEFKEMLEEAKQQETKRQDEDSLRTRIAIGEEAKNDEVPMNAS